MLFISSEILLQLLQNQILPSSEGRHTCSFLPPFSQLLLDSSPDSIHTIPCPCCHHPPRQGQKSQDTRTRSGAKTQGLSALNPDPFSNATRGSLTDRTQLHAPLAQEWTHTVPFSPQLSASSPHKHLLFGLAPPQPDLHLLQPPSPSPPALRQQL